MRDFKTVLVIEAPGKLQTLEKALRVNRFKGVKVVATGGHFFDYPKSLRPLGISPRFEEAGRAPDPARLKMLQDACRNRHVIIATDGDQEGHAIAEDVVQAVGHSAQSVRRCIFRDLSPGTIGKALRSLQKYDSRLVRPGRSRRILDRLIGSAWLNRGNGFAAGRVSSALLGTFLGDEPVIGHIVMRLPAQDNGPDFVARVPVTRKTKALWLERQQELTALPPAKAGAGRPVAFSPLSMGQMVKRLSVRLIELRA